ncbi:hypothetical protein WA026_015335 [Henosepilachna vigintioctopunctata]|uniref:CCHC-type domain-containing protein n=1 Tax=Henosepilachna vigintioctopunctata TaxID=420089 RepID=A0AAW1UJ27_9CUCU
MTTCDLDKKNNVSTFASKTVAQCFICGNTAHLKKDCWHGQRHNQGQQRGRGQRGYYREVTTEVNSSEVIVEAEMKIISEVKVSPLVNLQTTFHQSWTAKVCDL